MKYFKHIIIINILLYLLLCCRTSTIYVPTEKKVEIEKVIHHVDTIIEYNLEYVRDTLQTNDSISYLSNKYSYSYASILNGILSHSLTVYDTVIYVETQKEIEYITIKEKESYPVYVEVEKKQPLKDKIIQYIIVTLCCMIPIAIYILMK